MNRFVRVTAMCAAASVAFVAGAAPVVEFDGRKWDKAKVASPSRVTVVVKGGTSDFYVTSWNVVAALVNHWNDKRLMQARGYYLRPSGGSDSFGNAVLKRKDDKSITIVIEQFADHATLAITEEGGLSPLVYAPFVVRSGMKAQNTLTIKGDASAIVSLKVEEGIPEAAAGDEAARPPAGHHLVFSDHFRGYTENWGSRKLTTPGLLSIQKKNYFCYSYPILLPGLVIDDGVISFDAMVQKDTTGVVRFRASETGDDYYAFTFKGGSRASASFSKTMDGKDTKIQGKASRLAATGRVRFELCINGPKITATANGEQVAWAEDGDLRSGGVFICGCPESVVQFCTFDVYGKDGGKTSWKPVREQAAKSESAVRELPLSPVSPERGEVFADAAGRVHHWRVEGGFLVYDGLPYVPMSGSDGQYFLLHEPAAVGDARVFERVRDEKTLDDIRRHGLTWQGVFLRLVDYIDPSKTDHAFSEDCGIGGKSRLEKIGGDVFRVTSPRKSLVPYFSYTVNYRRARKMHVVAALVPNDVERYLGVFPLPNESGSFGVATGRTFPVDGRNYFAYACYYPHDVKNEWIFLSNTYAMRGVKGGVSWPKNGGGAVGGLWVMEPIGEETDFFPKATPPASGPERTIGDYNQRPGALFSNFGVKADDKKPAPSADRIAAFGAWLDHVRFSGCNDAQVCWFGIDWLVGTGANNIGYGTKMFAAKRKNAFDYARELCPEVERRGMTTLASTATFNFDDWTKKDIGLSDEDIRIGPDGNPLKSFGTNRLEPASPKAREVYRKVVREVAEAARGCAAVRGVAISLDGFFTLEGGWGELPLRRFERECGVKLPSYVAAEAHAFVTNDASRLAKWRAWRARDGHALICSLRDEVRAVRSDWTLFVRCLTPYSYKFEKVNGIDQRAMLLKDGIDPDLYRDEEGMVFLPRTWYEAKVKLQPGEWSFAYDHGVMDVPTKYGTGHHQWTGYWESPGMFPAGSKFTYGWLGCPNTIPVGRTMLETFTYHLANENVRCWSYQAWESALESTEHLLRRMATAYRALPVAEPVDVKDGVKIVSGGLRREDLKIAWYGDRLGVVNPTAKSGVVSVRTDGDMIEYGRLRRYGRGLFSRAIEIEVQPYDLLVFGKVAE